MSTLKTNSVQVGQSITATNNFTLYQPSTPDGTVRLGVGNSGATTADVITATSAGNVGIGTSNSVGKLTVTTTSSNGDVATWGTGQLVVSPGATTTSTGFGISVDTANNITYVSSLTPGIAWRTLGYRANSHIFYSSGSSETARFDSAGNFIIRGTGTGGNEAVDSLTFGGANSGTPYMVSNSSSTNRVRLFFQYNSTTVGTISSTNTATAYNTNSDYRLKDSVAPMKGALAKVAALKPCTYKWKVDNSDGEGFIAHELAEVVPGCVTGEKDAVDENGNIKPQGIDTSFLVATLTAAIQELKAELDSVKTELAALKAV